MAGAGFLVSPLFRPFLVLVSVDKCAKIEGGCQNTGKGLYTNRVGNHVPRRGIFVYKHLISDSEPSVGILTMQSHGTSYLAKKRDDTGESILKIAIKLATE